MAEESRNNSAGVNLSELRQTLASRFSDSDIRDLAFDLDIEYNDLPGPGKADKAREMIAYCRRHDRLPELLDACRRLRPDVTLPGPPPTQAPEPAPPAPASPYKPVHQLRNPVTDFIGRTAEIAEIARVLSTAALNGAGATAIIRGLGGLGKTQLANMVAQQMRESFPDGQIFLELQGVAANAIPPERVVQRVIQIFEPQAEVPETLGDLQVFYRAVLTGKRVLIVADNAKDEAQVRALEPPPGCALLVTSRQRFSLPGARLFDLEALSQAEAEDLLLKICPRIKSYAGKLADLCGRLPLALRVSASLLQNDLTQNIERYLQALERERLHYLSDPESPNDPNVSVSASLNLSYKALNDARQRILRQISVFPASFDLAAAKAVISLQGIKAGAGDERELQAELEAAGIAMPTTPAPPLKRRGRAVVPREEESLGILYRRSLVEYDTATERYNLHDLVRAFAAERLKTADEQLRYVQHYLEVARQANYLYNQNHEFLFQGLRLFDSERAHIDAAWEWLRQQPHSPATDHLIVAFANETERVGFLRYNRRQERIPQFKESLDAAERLRRKDAQARFLNTLGYDHYGIGETRLAIKFLNQSLHVSQEIGDQQRESDALTNLGLAYAALGDFRQSIGYYERILSKKSRSFRNPSVLNNLGLTYIELGHAAQALTFFEQALKINRESGDRDREGANVGNMGRAYIDLNEADKAVALCEQSLAIKQQLGHRWHEGYAMYFLGLACTAAGDLARAFQLQDEALVIARETGNRRIESQILNALGEISILKGDQAAAIGYLEQSLAIARRIEDRNGETLASWNLGRAYEQQGALARAAELMQPRVEYEQEIGHLRAEEHTRSLEGVRARLADG